MNATRPIEDRDRLVLEHLGLVRQIAAEFRGFGAQREDLTHEGILGLIEAARRFDPERGVRFSTYASWWIRKHVLVAANDAGPLSVSSYRRRQLEKIRRAARDLRGELGHEPTRDEISRGVAASAAVVERAMGARPPTVYLDDPGRAEGGRRPVEEIADRRQVPAESTLIQEERRRAVVAAFGRLKPRERVVIGHRVGIDGLPELTLREIGVRLRLSRERVRQVEEVALRKLRRAMAEADRRGGFSGSATV